MKISQVKITTDKDSVLLKAQCHIRHYGPDTVYFKFDKKYQDFIFEDASPFAACLLVPSMKLGEDLIIEGSIPKKLFENLYKIQEVFLGWDIGYNPIDIKVDKLTVDKFTAKSFGSFFSGGVDSFHTYLKHKNTKEKVNYFILINGYDMELKNVDLWKATSRAVDGAAKDEGNVEVIKVESNIHDLIEPISPWDYNCGGCLAAVGLSLRKKIKAVYLPGAYTTDQLFPAGEHPDIDDLYRTETFRIIPDGEDTPRVDKVRVISKNPSALKYLRVCYKNTKGAYNCGVCDKCLRTMVSLQIAGKLSQAKTLPPRIDLDRIRNLEIKAKYNAIFHAENLKGLEKSGKDKELEKALRVSLNRFPKEEIEHHVETFPRKILFLDHMYFRGTLRKIVQRFKKII